MVVPIHPYVSLAAMIMSQYGASGWTSWAIPSCYQTSLGRAGRNTTSRKIHIITESERCLDVSLFTSWLHPRTLRMCGRYLSKNTISTKRNPQKVQWKIGHLSRIPMHGNATFYSFYSGFKQQNSVYCTTYPITALNCLIKTSGQRYS